MPSRKVAEHDYLARDHKPTSRIYFVLDGMRLNPQNHSLLEKIKKAIHAVRKTPQKR